MNAQKFIISTVIMVLAISTITLGAKLYSTSNTLQSPVNVKKEDASAPKEISKIAKIISVEPKYSTKQVPYKDCNNQITTQIVKKEKNGTTGGIVGGIVGAGGGALAGNSLKSGGVGLAIGAVVGAIGGAFAGNQIQKGYAKDQYEPGQSNVTVTCNTQYKTIKKISGYSITYEYNGEINTVFKSKKPKSSSVPIQNLV